MNEGFMREAIRLSCEMMRQGRGGPFGAVIVREGRILSRGWNEVTSSNDPTAHAEIMAIRQACRELGTFRLGGCELYASCEPCPMCLGAAYWARLDRVVFGATRTDAAQAGFDDDLIYREILLPPDSRSHLPMVQMLRGEAMVALTEWEKTAGKVRY
jgi:guanine deaminase